MIDKFINENLEKDLKSFELRDDIYVRYLAFCEHYKIQALTRTRFGKKLDEFNIGIRHKRMKNYVIETGRQGVRLLSCKY
ncbi:primase-like DNA-binding domain-containing protein [Sporosarcina newyorkensis]|uniref:primase-like DNA-binding domain-containing protein n=1 Tax=Sporosarcina newyorkensis TaxID=759851 RepID=UPI003D05E0C7